MLDDSLITSVVKGAGIPSLFNKNTGHFYK